MQNVPDPYRLLGLRRDATLTEIKAAHRALAKRYHPDAPQGNRDRFLAVQEAYRILSDPLLRREWDARHSGPVRADDPLRRARSSPGGARPHPGPDRPRPGSRPGRRTGPAQADAGRGAPGRGTAGDGSSSRAGGSYTWSARGVPWWEEGEATRAKRQPGRQRPHEPQADGPLGRGRRQAEDGTTGSRGAGPAGSGDPANAGAGTRFHERPSRTGGPDGQPHRAQPSPEQPSGKDVPRDGSSAGGDRQPDFDVYSRSSGAAWSSAARAYFRRGVEDLPRGRAPWASRPRPHDQPHHSHDVDGRQASADPVDGGSPPEAGPDAAPASDPPRTADDRGRQTAWPRPPSSRAEAASTARDSPRAAEGGPNRQVRSPRRVRTPRGTDASAGARAEPASARGLSGRAGVVGGAPRSSSGALRGRAADAARSPFTATEWPAPAQRLLYGTAGWLPPALAVGYAGGALSGCDRAAVSCPAYFEALQALVIATLLAVLIGVPRAGYLAAAGSAALAVIAVLLVVLYAVIGVPQPTPQPVAVLTVAAWVASYLLGIVLASRDWPVPRPWATDWGAVARGDAARGRLGVTSRLSRR